MNILAPRHILPSKAPGLRWDAGVYLKEVGFLRRLNFVRLIFASTNFRKFYGILANPYKAASHTKSHTEITQPDYVPVFGIHDIPKSISDEIRKDADKFLSNQGWIVDGPVDSSLIQRN